MAQAAAKKISIFPFDVTVEVGGAGIKTSGVKINTTGMMLEVFVNTFAAGMPTVLKWILPLDNIAMEEEGKIVKIYSQQKEKHIQYLVEVHFKNLKPKNADAITSLMDRYEAALKKQTAKKDH